MCNNAVVSGCFARRHIIVPLATTKYIQISDISRHKQCYFFFWLVSNADAKGLGTSIFLKNSPPFEEFFF
jgi:hypothetical protein